MMDGILAWQGMWYQQGGLHVVAEGALLGVQHGQHRWDAARAPTSAYFAEQWKSDHGVAFRSTVAIDGLQY